MSSLMSPIEFLKSCCPCALKEQAVDNQKFKPIAVALMAIAFTGLIFAGLLTFSLTTFSLPSEAIMGIFTADIMVGTLGLIILKSIKAPEDVDNLNKLKRRIDFIVKQVSNKNSLSNSDKRNLILEQIDNLSSSTHHLDVDEEDLQMLFKMKEFCVLSFIFEWIEKKQTGAFNQKEFNLRLELLLEELQRFQAKNLNLEEVEKLLAFKKACINNFIGIYSRNNADLSSSRPPRQIPQFGDC